MENLLILLLGWLMGLLSPAIVDAIKRGRENKLGRQAILGELQELSFTLAIAALGVRHDQRTADREYLEKLKAHLERHGTSDDSPTFISSLRTQLSWSDEAFEQARNYWALKEGRSTVLQHYPVPLLDARVSALWSFDTSFQRDLLNLRKEINFLDDLVDRARKYDDLTFAEINEGNHQRAVENQFEACTQYAVRAERIVKLISGITG